MSAATVIRERVANVRMGYPSAAGNDQGFVLIEVLVSMIIFAIVAAGATLAIISGVSGSSATQNRVSTANIAQQAIQQTEAMSHSDLAALAAKPTPSTSTATAGSFDYTVTRTITYSPAGATSCPTAIASGTPYSMVVHVSVTGTGQNARTVAMDTVIAC